MHDLVNKRIFMTRIFCHSIRKTKTLWSDEVVTNYAFTHLKVDINLL